MNERFYDPFAPVQADQYAPEFRQLLEIVMRQNPRKVLEIGTREGGSLYQFMKYIRPGALIVSVDIHKMRWGSGREPNLDRWRAWADSFGHTLIIIRGDSHHPDTIKKANEYGPFDFVFVDGDHRLEGVSADYANYCRDARIVAIHDIIEDATDDGIKVFQFWQALKQENSRTEELISDPEQNGYGIGLVRNG